MHLAAILKCRRGYLFTSLGLEERIRQMTGHSLATWTSGDEMSSSDEIASCQLRLDTQSRGAPVPPIKGIPILLFAGESQEEEDNAFVRWVHRKRHFTRMFALIASANVADVRLERRLRLDYTSLKV